MKKVFFTILMFLPLMASAQEVLTPEEQLKKAQQQLIEAQQAVAKAKEKAEAAAKAAEQAKAQAEARRKAAEQEAAKKQKDLEEQKRKIEEQIKAAQAEAARLQAEADKLNADAEKSSKDADKANKTDYDIITTLPAKEADRKPVVTETPQNVSSEKGGTWTYNVSGADTDDDVDKQETKKTVNGVELKDDPKYLEGAVTVDKDGNVVFERSIDANGKSANEIYAIVRKYFAKLVKNENNVGSSMIDITNKNENKFILVAQMDEWLVFNASFISLDRTEIKYRLMAYIYDNKVDMKMETIRYAYEVDRSTGFKEPAKNVITDKYALSKKKNKLARIYGKFRKATIDRKDQIFSDITKLVKQ